MYDETYRKAGKLDRTDFSTPFCPRRATLIDRVDVQLLTGRAERKGIDFELYKLNVYGTDL